MPLDNKISNIIGTKLPQWLLNQLDARAKLNAQDSRDNNNLLYLTNKSAWVRVVSSINLTSQNDVDYFNRIAGPISKPEDLAKQYVLFGGTAKYINKNSYQLRSGLGKDGSYGTLGESEIQRYGYRPMPGITGVNIETQGRLGSVRAATINFRCWDKDQLDIIDALYFKLGFTMFLEWGNTYFYKASDSTQLLTTETYSIDPFQDRLTKEQIQLQISRNVRQTEGNYDAMLGIVTNFNFSLNQEGGYDCSIRLMALGVLGEALKINNQGNLPNILQEEIRQLTNTLIQISDAQNLGPSEPSKKETQQSILAYLNSKINKYDLEASQRAGIAIQNIYAEPNNKQQIKIVEEAGILNSTYTRTQKIQNFDFLYDVGEPAGWTLFSQKYGAQISKGAIDTFVSSVSLDINKIFSKLKNSVSAETATPGPDPYAATPDINVGASQSKDFYTVLFDKTIKSGSDVIEERTYKVKYQGKDGKDYYIEITVYFDKQDKNNNISIGKFYLLDRPLDVREAYIRSIKKLEENNIFSFNRIGLQVYDKGSTNYNSTPGGKYFELQLSGDISSIKVPGTVINKTTSPEGVVTETKSIGEINLKAGYVIKITDTDLITDIVKASGAPDYAKVQANIANQNQSETTKKEDQAKEQDALYTQIKQAIDTQSSLELTLRTIQVHALNKAIISNKNDLEIGRKVYTLNIADPDDKSGSTPFLNQIFSNGIFSSFINELVDKKKVYDLSQYDNGNMSIPDRLKLQAKYGFATNLMGGREAITSFKENNFESLLTAYVVPYQINQEIYQGVNTNHPVYIPLGLLLMILNHNCTMYDSKKNDANKGSEVQTPIVYVDFSTEQNFCLSNTKQLSTNPWITLIPFEGSFTDYKAIFDSSVLDGDNIRPASGSQEKIPLFDPSKQDLLSSQIPPFKFDGQSNNIYRGKVMNILLNVDYLVKLARDYSLKDETNSIYLKTFLEQILSDLNKYLGNINVFRLAYNDQGNTFYIVDDQVIPPATDREEQLQPDNTTSLPVFGKFSIAKNLEIKTEVSSKLSNMLAISANANSGDKATLSLNGDPFGFVNTKYQDRYVTNRSGIDTGSLNRDLEMLKNSAAQFNKTIYDFYSTINPSEAAVSHATNFFIERMAKIKNDEYPTRAAAMIPVSVNFTTDGISGMSMGQSFTIPDQILPYTYNARNVTGERGLQNDHINKVGFVVVGLNHSLENNQWNTSVRSNMIFLKYTTDFSGSVVKLQKRDEAFGIDTSNQINNQYVAIEKSTPIEKEQAIKITKTFFEQKGFKPVQVSAIIGALLQESQLNPNATNSIGAYGIAQWLGARKTNLLSKPDYSKLEVQLNYIIEEFNSTESLAGNRLRSSTTLEEAIAAMASYERYKGVTSKATYQDVLVAAETGFRIGYTKNIFNRYYNI
jgi:hypothetical protein